MPQIEYSLSPKNPGWILCYYVNATSIVQITRIANIPNWYFERVVFPGQRLLFEAPLEAKLEIHSGEFPNAILTDKIPCICLLVSVDTGKGHDLDSGGSYREGYQYFVQSTRRF